MENTWILMLDTHLEFSRVLWKGFVGHDGRMLVTPLEQRGEPGLVLWPMFVHVLGPEKRGQRKWMELNGCCSDTLFAGSISALRAACWGGVKGAGDWDLHLPRCLLLPRGFWERHHRWRRHRWWLTSHQAMEHPHLLRKANSIFNHILVLKNLFIYCLSVLDIITMSKTCDQIWGNIKHGSTNTDVTNLDFSVDFDQSVLYGWINPIPIIQLELYPWPGFSLVLIQQIPGKY